MICPNCGTDNVEGVTFCVNCGTNMNAPVQQPNGGQPAAAEDPGKGFAIASLVLGIVSLFFAAFISGTLAIVFAVMAKKKGSTNKMATAGMVLGIIGIASWLLMQVVCAICNAGLGLM